jgi:hypothetical protein
MCFGLFPCCWVVGFSGGSVMWVLFVALGFFFFWVLLGALCYTPGVIELCFKLAFLINTTLLIKKKKVYIHLFLEKSRIKETMQSVAKHSQSRSIWLI